MTSRALPLAAALLALALPCGSARADTLQAAGDVLENVPPAISSAVRAAGPEKPLNPQGGFMGEKAPEKPKYVYVKDSDGVEYVCRLEDLKKLEELSEEEKSKCMVPPGSA